MSAHLFQADLFTSNQEGSKTGTFISRTGPSRRVSEYQLKHQFGRWHVRNYSVSLPLLPPDKK